MADLITFTRVRRFRWVVARNRVNVVEIVRRSRGSDPRTWVYAVTGALTGAFPTFWEARRAVVAAIPRAVP